MVQAIVEWWCKTMHNRPMWPIHGEYICPDCLRRFPVAWEDRVLKLTTHPKSAASNPALNPKMS